MNKLEDGMYVRHKRKGIFKITNDKIQEENKIPYIGVSGNYTVIELRNIKKSSYNIIDLIEVGDYVNGLEVYETGTFGHNGKRFCRLYGNVAPFYNSDIKSIVTKEQFESMEYKVGDSNE